MQLVDHLLIKNNNKKKTGFVDSKPSLHTDEATKALLAEFDDLEYTD